MTPDTVMLFAAGLGTRMRPLTNDRPKALVEVAGRTLLDHAMTPAEQLLIPRRVVNAHWMADHIEAAVAGRGVLLSDERDLLRETGGGLRHALPLLGPEPVFTMNTDAVWSGPNPYAVLAEAWNPDQMDALVLLVPPERAHAHPLKSGFAMGPDGRAWLSPDLAYTGAQILRTDGLGDIADEVFSLRVLWDRAHARKRLFGVIYDGHWCDVGTPAAVTVAEDMLERFA